MIRTTCMEALSCSIMPFRLQVQKSSGQVDIRFGKLEGPDWRYIFQSHQLSDGI